MDKNDMDNKDIDNKDIEGKDRQSKDIGGNEVYLDGSGSDLDGLGFEEFLDIIGSGSELSFGAKEFNYLRNFRPNSVLLAYESELMSLYNKFRSEGYSGSFTEAYVVLLCEGLGRLLRGEPLVPLTDSDMDFEEYNDRGLSQSRRLFSVFRQRDVLGGRAYYNHAIHFRDVDTGYYFSGSVYMNKFSRFRCYSRNFIKYPFIPKTFEIDVKRKYVSGDALRSYLDSGYEFMVDGDGNRYYYYVLDWYGLSKAYAYYDHWVSGNEFGNNS